MLGLVDALRWGGIVDPHRSTYLAVYKEFASRVLELQYFRAGSAKSVGLLTGIRWPSAIDWQTDCLSIGHKKKMTFEKKKLPPQEQTFARKLLGGSISTRTRLSRWSCSVATASGPSSRSVLAVRISRTREY